MPNSQAAKLIENIKRAAKEEREASQPSGIFFGTVISPSPLKISVEQKMTLTEKQLILSTLVQEFEVEMTVDHITENYYPTTDGAPDFPGTDTEEPNDNGAVAPSSPTGTGDPPPHRHRYEGKKKFKVHLELKAGEKVILIREQGGQKFIVLDRIRG